MAQVEGSNSAFTGWSELSLARLKTRLDRTDRWILHRPALLIVLVITLVGLAKQGPRFLSGFSSEALNFPGFQGQDGPVFFEHTLALVRVLGITNIESWALVSFVLLVAMQLIMGFMLFRSFDKRSAVMIFGIVILGQLGLIMTNQFGREDMFLVFGAFLVIFASSKVWPLWFAGALLMVLANSGQTLFAAMSLVLLSLFHPFARYRIRSLVVAGLAGVWLVMEQVFAPGATQIDLFPVLLRESLNASLFTTTLRVASIFGAVWALVVVFLLALRGPLLVIATLVYVIAPVVLTLVTLDGTRVGVGVTALTLMALLSIGIPPLLMKFKELDVPVLFLGLFILIAFPTVNVFFYTVEVPWAWILGFTSRGAV